MRPLRVLTYNIQFCRGTDRVIDIGRIADAIAPFDPDVVALQEVDIHRPRSGHRDQAALIAERLGLAVQFGPTIERGSERYGNATLTRLPVLATRHVRLPRRRPEFEQRAALITSLRWDGLDIDLVNTHLSTKGDERQPQVDELVSALRDAPTILCGDLNCTPWSGPYRTLARRLQPIASPRSWPAQLPVFPIDHIFVARLRVVRAGRWTGPGARRASDHAPVFAELH